MTRRRQPRMYCAACERSIRPGKYRNCSSGCGAKLCRARHIPHCTDLHAGQCPNYQPMKEAS